MKINYKRLIIYILIPLILGSIIGLLTSGNYNEIVMPKFTPPKILFPIVWSILYILMGISRYIIDSKEHNHSAITIYKLQLLINLIWPFLFFNFKWYLFSFIWIIILITLVTIMIIKFFNLSKTSGLLQIPYLLWLIFASILNFAVYTLN